MAFADELPLHQDRIHVSNGTWYLDGHFSEEKEYCRNRLKVAYNSAAGIANVWLNFLSELLIQEDIPTLQEYLGYCLPPTTKAQKMLLMIGKGGEGKSRIGLVVRSILGINMNTTSIQKVETNRFARAGLEDKLLMVDDDMDMSALTKTIYIKSIVTSECQMDVERKGIQSYQSLLYVRFLCFGNGALTALHDRSDGFFRRQIVITTKDKPEGRVDDPYLVEKLTDGYNLPAKKVIHIVGPIVSGMLTKALEQDLADCYRNTLDLCLGNGIKSVAFCCISTGVFHFPNRRAAEIAVQTVTDWMDEHPGRMDTGKRSNGASPACRLSGEALPKECSPGKRPLPG